jgi:hypothetical protein
MRLERRSFLKTLGTGALITSFPLSRSGSVPGETDDQRLHRDYQSANAGTEYFIIGNGRILAALQVSATPDAGTHCGLLLMSPEHFGRKISTYLYHPERGLQNSRCFVHQGGKAFLPEPASSRIFWKYPDGLPTVVTEWMAGDCAVTEEFFCPANDAVIIRTVRVKAGTTGARAVSLTHLLYPNLMYFDEYDVDRVNGTLTASGYKTLRLFASKVTSTGDRHLAISVGDLRPGEEQSVTFYLSLDTPRASLERKGLAKMTEESRKAWEGVATVETGDEGLDHLFRVSTAGMRAAVARSGKMDGSIWQYNLEWVRDQSMVAAGAAMAGLTDVSESLLNRMLERSVDDDGKTVDASRHRPPETMELDQNGELLFALSTHWTWSGKDHLLRKHWKKIARVAEYVLNPTFRDPQSGLVRNSREYWERDGSFGVKEGYENAYQFWNIVGLEKAARMAAFMKEPALQRKWLQASRQMRESYLNHPTHSLVDGARFIKRRLVNGDVQWTFEPPNRASMPPGMPLNVETTSWCDPDTSSALPIAFEVADPRSDLSAKTLESLEQLWNQRWSHGGYGRYHVTSEPDSPGPWPFASMFVARAYFEAGNDEKVWRVLRWLQGLQGGKAGAWLEFYGERPTPPLPPVGIVVWTWAEICMFFIHHLLGVRPEPDALVLRPRLLNGLTSMNAQVRVRGVRVNLNVRSVPEGGYAMVNGSRMALSNGALRLPLPRRDMSVEFSLS